MGSTLAGLMLSGLAVGLALAVNVVGCVSSPSPPPSSGGFAPRMVRIPEQPPVEQVVVAEVLPTPPSMPESEASAPTSPDALPSTWEPTSAPARVPFVEAMRSARSARVAFEAAASASLLRSDGGAPSPKHFERASALLDMTSRQLAAAYHAPDATAGNKLDALHQAATMILGWSRRLDELGLARAPASYRADPSIALTFEDVANGPAKRWRSEGAALARRCVELARASSIESLATRECRLLHATYARVMHQPQDAGAAPTGTACACDPGDPLCSTSMSGWCSRN